MKKHRIGMICVLSSCMLFMEPLSASATELKDVNASNKINNAADTTIVDDTSAGDIDGTEDMLTAGVGD